MKEKLLQLLNIAFTWVPGAFSSEWLFNRNLPLIKMIDRQIPFSAVKTILFYLLFFLPSFLPSKIFILYLFT